jgi:hypothetical protein
VQVRAGSAARPALRGAGPPRPRSDRARLEQIARDDTICDPVRVIFVRVGCFTGTTFEVHTRTLLDDVGSFVRSGVNIRVDANATWSPVANACAPIARSVRSQGIGMCLDAPVSWRPNTRWMTPAKQAMAATCLRCLAPRRRE